jgi:hypothetical protein
VGRVLRQADFLRLSRAWLISADERHEQDRRITEWLKLRMKIAEGLDDSGERVGAVGRDVSK